MANSSWFLLTFLPAGVEMLVLLVRPTWIAPFAFLPVTEHRFTLRGPRRDPNPRAGYRDPGGGQVPLPELPARTELTDSVLYASGPRIALRRAYSHRNIWVVAIEIQQIGDDVALRAKQAFVPMTLPLVLVGMLIGTPGSMSASQMLIFPVFLAVFLAGALGIQYLFLRGSRDEGVAEAFRFLEEELREALEEPETLRIRARPSKKR